MGKFHYTIISLPKKKLTNTLKIFTYTFIKIKYNNKYNCAY